MLIIGGIICNFGSILPYFRHWGMNLDHNFFQVSKLSEDQKKEDLHQKLNSFFPQIPVKTKKKGLHQKRNSIFPQIQLTTKKKRPLPKIFPKWRPALTCTPESNY